MPAALGSRRRGADDLRDAVARDGAPLREQVADIQRARLLTATVCALEELGYERATVARITHRARISRRTFYELFAGREECVAAVIQDAAEELAHQLQAADLGGLPWCERVRGGLWRILCFLDSEPALARVFLVHAPRGGGAVLARRDELIGRLTAVVDAGRRASARTAACTELTAEGLVGAALAILQARLARRGSPPLADVLGELMAMIVLPYQGPAAARRELHRPPPPIATSSLHGGSVGASDPLAALPMRLTYRTVRVLEAVGANPGASNRRIAEHAGIFDQGQVSKLLARLERLGLLANEHRGRVQGEPNAWTLTPQGTAIEHSIATYAGTTNDETKHASTTNDNAKQGGTRG